MGKFILVALLFCLSLPTCAGKLCTGKFINPISDICWNCLFPISVGNLKMAKSRGNPDTSNPSLPVQVCQNGNVPRIGVAIGYWEPSYLVDVTTEPYCMVNLGGFSMAKGKMGSGYTQKSKSTNQGGFYNVHWYQYPVMSWLNMALDFGCMQASDFGIAYLSELDPTWSDDELAAMLSPESILFANLIAQGACGVDATASMFDTAIDSLFWCAGSHGSMYPISGYVPNEASPFKTSLLVAERMVFKMHRQGLVLNTIGENRKVCHAYFSPVMPKSRWRYQMVNKKSLNRCDAVGRIPMVWEIGLNIPTDRHNYGYLFWRKRNCVYL